MKSRSTTMFRPAARRLTPALAALLLAAASGPVLAQPTPLKTLAQAHDLTIGVAVTFPFGNREVYDSLVVRNFTGIVAENDHKWGSISSNPGQYNWTNSDRMVDFAQMHDLKLRFHAFVWHQQSSYIANGSSNGVALPEEDKYTREEAFTHMRNHITTVMGRYKERNPGVFYEWDVVNEAVARDSAGMRLSTGDPALLSRWVGYTQGEENDFDYVDSAFVIAHRADSTAKLYYNDYDAEGMGVKSNLVYSLISKLKDRGIPLHGLGMQCHWHLGQEGTTSNGAWVPQEMVENMARIAALGLDISLTEIDIRIELPADSVKLQEQREAYETVLSMCLAQPACKSFFIWGMRDGQSWINSRYEGFGAPLLFSGTGSEYNPKPAYDGLIHVLQTTTAIKAEPGTRRRPAMTYRAQGPIRDLLGRKVSPLPGGRAFTTQSPEPGAAR